MRASLLQRPFCNTSILPFPCRRPPGWSADKTVHRTVFLDTMVGNAVAAARAKKGISQKELSEATGIDQSDLSKIERGAANPSVGTLNRIAEALDAKLFVSIA